MDLEVEVALLKERVENLRNAPELAPAINDLATKVVEFKGVVDGLALNQKNSELLITKLEGAKKTTWDRLNEDTDKIAAVEKDIIKLEGEDKVMKVKLGWAHKAMVWLALVISIVTGLIALFGG